jgi:shikimate dehydrogenase
MSMEIDGKTRLFAIVADPIEQVKAPQTINALLQSRGFNGVLVPAHVAAADLADYLKGLRSIKNFGGMVVTVPHKQAMVKLCDEVSDAARLVGAVNIVRRESDGRMVGEILDGKGFVVGLRSNGIEPKGLKVFMAGAGGAANAIAFALAQEGIASLGVHNRSLNKVNDLVSRLHQAFPELPVQAVGSNPKGFDLVVNATSLGMKDTDPLPMDLNDLVSEQVVAEIIMKPELTAMLKFAQARGCKIHFGLPMLRSQADLMIQFMGVSG